MYDATCNEVRCCMCEPWTREVHLHHEDYNPDRIGGSCIALVQENICVTMAKHDKICFWIWKRKNDLQRNSKI